MRQSRNLTMLIALVAVSMPCLAARPTAKASPPRRQAVAAPAPAPAAHGRVEVCVDVRTNDRLTEEFADRVRKTVAASGAFSLATTAASCSLRLHVPGNLLRFETAGGVMVSTVVIVTSRSEHYLSASITACRATNLEPCAVRAVAAAKLALMVRKDDGT